MTVFSNFEVNTASIDPLRDFTSFEVECHLRDCCTIQGRSCDREGKLESQGCKKRTTNLPDKNVTVEHRLNEGGSNFIQNKKKADFYNSTSVHILGTMQYNLPKCFGVTPKYNCTAYLFAFLSKSNTWLSFVSTPSVFKITFDVL